LNPRIIIKVAKDGSTEVRTEGFVGNSCRQASELIERALGTRQSESLTSEYFNTTSTNETKQLHQGEGQ
jgi:hypothetical protein